MDPTGFGGITPEGWRARFVRSWPEISDRMLNDGGLRSLLLLVVALASGVRAEGLVDASAAALATLFGVAAIVLAPIPGADQASGVRGYILDRLSEPGTYRSLGVLVMAGQMGASAESVVDAVQALAMLAIGGISAAKPAPAVRP